MSSVTKDPTVKRKRLTQACELCRRKKIKCDGLKPACGNCTKLNMECKYSTTSKKRGPRQGYIEILEQRLAKLENKLLSPTESHEVRTPPVSNQQENSPSYEHEPSSDYVDTTQYTQTETELASTLSCMSSNIPSLIHTPNQSADTVDNMPSLEIVEHMFDLFFAYLFPTIPILDEVSLRTDLREGKCSDFLILCIIGACARFSDRPDIKENPAWLAGEKYAEKARSMLIKVLDEPNIPHLQGILLLSMHEYGCGRGSRSWMYGGIAIRMALELGLHEDHEEEDADQEELFDQEMKRRLFWSVFCIDKFSSASSGKPSSLDDTFCTVFLPVAFEWSVTDQYYTETLSGDKYLFFSGDSRLRGVNDKGMAHALNTRQPSSLSRPHLNNFAYIVRATHLIGKVTAFVNKNKGFSHERPPYQPDSPFAKMNKMVEEWVDQLPPYLQNTPENFDLNMNRPGPITNRLFLLIHALYNTSVVLLHRPSLIMIDNPSSSMQLPELNDFIHKSVDTCMSAVDRMTSLIKAIGESKELMPPFLTYLTYTVATVVVSCSFSPREEEAQKAKLALGVYFQLLLTARNYWAMADKLYFMVRDLYAIHSNVVRRQVDKQVMYDTPQQIPSYSMPPSNEMNRSFRTGVVDDPLNWGLQYNGQMHNQLFPSELMMQTPMVNNLYSGHDQPLLYGEMSEQTKNMKVNRP
ncbi:fungal-specific transcription factor domain-containing protein [Pilobolus umbonatus]|nr:fungal-specific transcription factor domain-containing protein [Pilobolus umbonatus]